MVVSCLVSSSTVKMEATCSSEDFQRTTWRYMSYDRTLQDHVALFFLYDDFLIGHHRVLKGNSISRIQPN
jgi:hypothetical protein